MNQPQGQPKQHNQQQEASTLTSNTKIETVAMPPSEQFAIKLATLVDGVVHQTMQPSQAIKDLQEFWRSEFTPEERDILVDHDKPDNILELGNRLSAIAGMFSSEMSALIAFHINSKGF